MNDFCTLRVNFKGGIISPGELQQILEIVKGFHVRHIKFGLRQQLFIHLPYALLAGIEKKFKKHHIAYQIDSNFYPNLVSSYVAEEVFQKGNWLSEGIYKDIFDQFDYEPKLKINISDNEQSFSPFFSGHINFIASRIPNFWHLAVRKPKSNTVLDYDKLIYTHEVARVCQQIEENIGSYEEENQDFSQIFSHLDVSISNDVEEGLRLPHFSLPYYEGFNRYGKKTWLGIYRRNESYAVDFLLEVCELCLNTRVGEICLTPWKSLIIKNIEENDRSKWSAVLAKYDINVRHAANELNWQVEDDSEEGLSLKNRIVNYFNQNDLRTFGLCFGVKIMPRTEVFASIMVQKRSLKLFGLIPLIPVYDLSFTEDFDPNGRTKKYFATGVLSINLEEQVRRMVLKYNHAVAENNIKKANLKPTLKEKPEHVIEKVHQCPTCYTIYDPAFGDELNDIPAGVPFKKLPADYCCPVCETTKEKFKPIKNLTHYEKI